MTGLMYLLSISFTWQFWSIFWVKKIQFYGNPCTTYKYQYLSQTSYIPLTRLQPHPSSMNCLVCCKSCWSSTMWSKPAEDSRSLCSLFSSLDSKANSYYKLFLWQQYVLMCKGILMFMPSDKKFKSMFGFGFGVDDI